MTIFQWVLALASIPFALIAVFFALRLFGAAWRGVGVSASFWLLGSLLSGGFASLAILLIVNSEVFL